MGKADLHIHTRHSDGLPSVEQVIAYVNTRTDLDVIAITDHEDVVGGLRARERAAATGGRVEVLPGVEVTTRHGHLIALNVETTPPLFRSVEATLERIHSLGGIAVVPHPMSWLTRSISRRTLERVIAAKEAGVTIDAIELCNPSPAGKITAKRARSLNRRWAITAIGGSDAHHLQHLGTGWTEFAGNNAASLLEAIHAGTTRARMSKYPSMKEIGFTKIAAGLAWGYIATPRKLVGRAIDRLRSGV